ncbi:MAG TPA: DUF4157 domain-containing protein [Candidatus Solibacter sp.]|nr:DUF4157 domain-containing protein [Candidatus Solibacter sp.]
MSFAPETAPAERDLQHKHAELSSSGGPAISDGAASPLGAVLSALAPAGSDSGGRVLSSPIMRQRTPSEARVLVMRRLQQGMGNYKAQHLIAQLSRTAMVQRECACGGTCSSCQQKAAEEQSESELVQRQVSGESDQPPATGVIPTDSPGHPLDRNTRAFMESRFGEDFSDVRVHTDAQAGKSADALAANAYTTGRDIYFAAGKYAPSTRDGQHLIAHELTHTVQQENAGLPAGSTTQARSAVVGDADSPMEHEAEQVADSVLTQPSGRTVSISRDAKAPVRRGIAGDIWDATGGRVVNYVGDKVEGAIDAAEDWIISKIEKYAPGLLKLLRMGIVDFLKEKITEGFDSIFGGVVSKVRKEGFLGAAADIIGEHTSSVSKAASGLLAGACDAFAHAAGAVVSLIKGIVGPVFDGVKKVASAVGDFFGWIWEHIGAPVWDAIKSVAGTVWNWIEEKAKWIWDKTAPIRDLFGRAWNWIKKQFGVAWDSGTGVLDWLKEKAKAAWDKVYEFTKPIHGALKVIGGVLLLLSPIGPIIAIWKGAPLLWDALTWLYAQWKKTDFIVLARQALTEHILPAIASGAQKAAELIESAATWIAEKVEAIDAALGGLLKALGVSSLLKLALSAVRFVADSFRKFANWVRTGFLKTLHKLKEVLLKVWAFVKPILTFLLKLAIVVTNPILLPIVITGYMWQLLPNCFKPPIIDFILDLLIAVVRALPTFKVLGEAWPPTKAKMLATLTELRNSSVEKKIEASNRAARIMSGDDLDWVGNLLSAMIKVPDYIEGQFEEELIGMDLTEPLPFERATEAKPADLAAQSAVAGTLPSSDAAILSNPSLAEGQIGVDHVADMELDPELVADLQSQGGEKEYRGPDDPARTIKRIQTELSGGGAQGDMAAGDLSGAGPQKPMSQMSTDEQLEQFMNQPAPNTCTQEKSAKSEGGGSIPEELKIGPLTRAQRARYLLHQIGQGIKTWFNCNSYWLIPAIIGVIAVLVALEILTGGAITAALPEILDIMAAIMIGVAAVRAAAYVAEYVGKAIAGEIVGAAKSLARGLAIVAIELIFALLFNLDKVIKTLKQGLKATAEAAAKAAKAAVKGTVESVEELGRIGVKGVKTAGKNIAGFGRAIVKNGKLLLEGIGEGFAKGIRKVEELFERLWNKLRFKAFRIRLTGGWFTLEGEINPWILLAKGKIKWIEDASILEGKGGKIGEKVLAKSGKDVLEGLLVGFSKAKPDYRKIIDLFLEEAVSKLNVIHHAIEQQVLKRFPRLFTLEEIHEAANLRTILKGAFNSEVHLSKIRMLWNDFYEVLKDAKLPKENARQAFAHFRDFVDEYIEAMKTFMATNKDALKAEAAGDKDALRALLAAESKRLLEGTKNAAQKAVDSARVVGAAK